MPNSRPDDDGILIGMALIALGCAMVVIIGCVLLTRLVIGWLR